jgi:hypothetical protein
MPRRMCSFWKVDLLSCAFFLYVSYAFVRNEISMDGIAVKCRFRYKQAFVDRDATTRKNYLRAKAIRWLLTSRRREDPFDNYVTYLVLA